MLMANLKSHTNPAGQNRPFNAQMLPTLCSTMCRDESGREQLLALAIANMLTAAASVNQHCSMKTVTNKRNQVYLSGP